MKQKYIVLLLIFFACFSIAEADINETMSSEEIISELDDDFDSEFDDEFADEFDAGIEEDFYSEFDDEFDVEIEEDFDPLSGYNRLMTGFNDNLYTYAVFPLARGYNYITPQQFRISIGNFFHNLRYPVRVSNNLLQLKFIYSLEETGRFLINSTIGLLGLFDPAKAWFDLEKREEDFGQTLGHYGVGGGFHVVLPFFGPSNLRDTLSLPVDWYIDPFFYQDGRSYNLLAKNFWQSIGLKSFQYFNDYSGSIEQYEALKKDAIDLYPFFKNVYEQNREQEIAE